jgi:hypothetical protein
MSFVHSPANRVKHRMSGSKQEVYAAQLQVFASALALSGSSRNEERTVSYGGDAFLGKNRKAMTRSFAYAASKLILSLPHHGDESSTASILDFKSVGS